MNQGSSTFAETEKPIAPIKLLEQIATSQASACLQVTTHDVVWSLYFYEGKLFYANNSLETIERVEQHLRRVCNNQLPNDLYAELRQKIAEFAQGKCYPSPEYRGIQYLVEHQHLSEQDAGTLIKNITKETIQSYLPITNAATTLQQQASDAPIWWSGNFLFISKECAAELQAWQALRPTIQSPYQRPYLANPNHQLLTDDVKTKLGKILIGFSFRQLSLLLKQDELTVANNLHRLIANGIVGLRPPQAPFDRLNHLYFTPSNETETGDLSASLNIPAPPPPPPTSAANEPDQPVYKIACVDDSPTILREINRFLDGDSFKVFPIVDSGTALMKIIRIDPDIILLDVGMPAIDGYKLCGMLRKHPSFKKTPIVMVTGNTGIIDRAKARMAGCTDYMTKPFTQTGLIEMVSRHLMENATT
jgi:two-component system, chemotaxis family, response regulator PixG